MLKALDIDILPFSTIYNVLPAEVVEKHTVNMAVVANAEMELALGWQTVFMQ